LSLYKNLFKKKLNKSFSIFNRDECSAQVLKFPGSIYKKFATESEAQNFIKERSSTEGTNSKSLASSKIVKSAR